MTLRELLEAMTHRWYAVVTVGVLAGLALAAFVADSGTYSTRTIVTFRFAETAAVASDNGSESESVIAFAGAVASEVNRGRPTPRYSSNNAPYYGAGIRDGVVVGLRDDGNQWAPRFTSAMLEIQIVGRTHERVAERQRAIVAEIEQIVAAQQALVHDPTDRISAHVEPLTTDIEFITHTRSTLAAAAAAMGIVVLLVGGWLAAVIDHRPRRSRPARPAGPSGRRAEGRRT